VFMLFVVCKVILIRCSTNDLLTHFPPYFADLLD
jgi:hypothetical protein